MKFVLYVNLYGKRVKVALDSEDVKMQGDEFIIPAGAELKVLEVQDEEDTTE